MSTPSQIGRYEILDRIGAGGMGTVYRAKLPTLERIVALKILSDECLRHPDLVSRFRQEANMLARMDHPNIVNIFDLDEHNEKLFYVMEYLPRSLADEIYIRQADGATRGVRPISFRCALDWFVQIAQGLAAIHAEGVVHRDLSPQNILIDTDLTAKISDFGIAKQLGCPSMTKTGLTGIGKEMYVAPEQWVDFKRADARSDIYSAGVIFYLMLTAHFPVGRFDRPRELAPHVPSELDALVMRCLDYQPETRYPGGVELLAALQTIDVSTVPDLEPEPMTIDRQRPTPPPVAQTPTRMLDATPAPGQPPPAPEGLDQTPFAVSIEDVTGGFARPEASRGTAIFSVVLLFLLCLWPLNSVLAALLGTINLMRIKRNPVKYGGRDMSIVAVVVGVVELLYVPLIGWFVYFFEWPPFVWKLMQMFVNFLGYQFS
ncbi:MAG: serine/threonine-protein kinase [Candidatus Alcyoniella australis]|nr:serine/threonine-protein kinase [Candidatus Alcyoniella australis]